MLLELAEEFGENFDSMEHFYQLYFEATKRTRYEYMYMKLRECPVQVFNTFTERIY